MTWIGEVILAALCLHYIVERLADALNLSAISPDVPQPFVGWYDPVRYAKAQAYLSNTTRLARVAATVELAVLLIFWFGRGFSFLDQWVGALEFGPVGSGLVFIGVLAGAQTLLDLPFAIYSTFVIEERFGFNRTPWQVFLSDRIKTLFLGVLLGVPLLAGVLWFFENAPAMAWLWCWIGVSLVVLALQMVVPAWILPLFNKFTPLEAGALKEAVLSCAHTTGFPLETVFVMDGSKRSAKSNAFFAGLGRRRRLVLFDTLIKNHPIPEIVAVVAHEIGHYKRHHLPQQTLLAILQAGILFYLLSAVISWPGLFEAFYVSTVSVHGGLVFFTILYSPAAVVLGVLTQVVSRRHEFAADAFSVATTGDAPAMADALKRLSVDNLANLTPHPFYVFLHYSHPPVADRIRAIDEKSA